MKTVIKQYNMVGDGERVDRYEVVATVWEEDPESDRPSQFPVDHLDLHFQTLDQVSQCVDTFLEAHGFDKDGIEEFEPGMYSLSWMEYEGALRSATINVYQLTPVQGLLA